MNRDDLIPTSVESLSNKDNTVKTQITRIARKQMIEIVELFGALPRSALRLMATSPSGLDEDRLWEIQELQRQAQSEVALSRTVVAALPVAITKAARDIHQTDDLHIDDVRFPYDVAEGDGGTWVAAWVWVPTDDIQETLEPLKD